MRTIIQRDFLLAFWLLFILAVSVPAQSSIAAAPRHPLRIDDVLDTVSLDRVALSPDGQWIAAVAQRPAREGEIFGRTFYEVDPSRADIWLISRRTGEQRNLTRGASVAAGYWCATWSPDGRHLAMLSTRPEGSEPRGGDNVRLYVWSSDDDSLRRLSQRPAVTQTRYGGSMFSIALHASASGAAQECRRFEENAPFIWLDNRRLLALFLREGQRSALLDQYSRPADHAVRTQRLLREGIVPTATAVTSGAASSRELSDRYQVTLAEVRVDTGEYRPLAVLPAHPFSGTLSIRISPTSRHVAVLATTGPIPLQSDRNSPYNSEDWQAKKILGIVDLRQDGPVRWISLPDEARYPLELLDWGPGGRAIAFRARATPDDATTSLFIAGLDGAVRQVSNLRIGSRAAGPFPHESSLFWLDDDRLLVRGRQTPEEQEAWWLARTGSAAVPVRMENDEQPIALRRSWTGALVGIAGRHVLTLSADSRRFEPLAARPLPEDARIAWPPPGGVAADSLLVASSGVDGAVHERVALGRPGEERQRATLPRNSQLLAVDDDRLIWQEASPEGLFLWETELESGARRSLMSLNTHLASVARGRTTIIDYTNGAGQAARAAVIFPPDYREGRRYPVIAWIYGGTTVQGPDDYWLDPYRPGIYNLQLYAARGYVVVVPSLSRWSTNDSRDIYGASEDGLLPALDKLEELGIADPRRIGIMGQSFGGYTWLAGVP